MIERTVWYVVGDLNDPKSEPFVVMSVDTSVRREGGVEGTVVSLHWTRDEAQRIADAFNERETYGSDTMREHGPDLNRER